LFLSCISYSIEMSLSIGFLGLGLMGSVIAKRLADQSRFSLMIWNRSVSAVQQFKKTCLSAEVASSPAAVFAASRLVFTMLSDAKAMRETILSDEVKEKMRTRPDYLTVVQLGTIGREDAVSIQKEVESCGASYIEMPVLGSTAIAAAGELQLLAAGRKDLIESYREVFSVFGNIRFISEEIGKAAIVKLALNNLIISQTAAIALSISLVKQSGIPIETFWDILKGSIAYSPYFDYKFSRMNEHNHSHPNFSTLMMTKDINLIIEEAKQNQMNPAGLEGIRNLAESTIASGYGEDDMSALIEAILGNKK